MHLGQQQHSHGQYSYWKNIFPYFTAYLAFSALLPMTLDARLEQTNPSSFSSNNAMIDAQTGTLFDRSTQSLSNSDSSYTDLEDEEADEEWNEKSEEESDVPPDSRYVQYDEEETNIDSFYAQYNKSPTNVDLSPQDEELGLQDDFYEQTQSPYIAQNPAEAPRTSSDNFFLTHNMPTWDEVPSEWDDSNACGACYLCYNNPCGTQRRFVDFLYWQLAQNDLEYAMTACDLTQDSNQILSGCFRKKFVCADYKPGFRVGALFASQNWEFGATFTYLHSSYRDSVQAKCGCKEECQCDRTLIFSQAPEAISNPQTGWLNNRSAHSSFHLAYNMLDLLAVTSYITSNCWTWRPYIGVRLLHLKQQWKIAYTAEETKRLDSYWLSKLPSGGLTCGLSGIYALTSNWNITGRLGVSAIGGSSKRSLCFTNHENNSSSSSSSSSRFCPPRVHAQNGIFLGGMDGALGLAFVVRCANGMAIQSTVGYEFQSWYNVPQPFHHARYTPTLAPNLFSCLTLHGLVVRAGVAF